MKIASMAFLLVLCFSVTAFAEEDFFMPDTPQYQICDLDAGKCYVTPSYALESGCITFPIKHGKAKMILCVPRLIIGQAGHSRD